MLKVAGLHRDHEDSLLCKIFCWIYKVEKTKNNSYPGLVIESLVKKNSPFTLKGSPCETGIIARPMQNKISWIPQIFQISKLYLKLP